MPAENSGGEGSGSLCLSCHANTDGSLFIQEVYGGSISDLEGRSSFHGERMYLRRSHVFLGTVRHRGMVGDITEDDGESLVLSVPLVPDYFFSAGDEKPVDAGTVTVFGAGSVYTADVRRCEIRARYRMVQDANGRNSRCMLRFVSVDEALKSDVTMGTFFCALEGRTETLRYAPRIEGTFIPLKES